MNLLLFLVIGAAAGFVGGLLGVGGGIVIVPALAVAARFDMQSAIGTSSAIIVFTAISSTYKHHINGNVVWPTVAAVAVASVLCAYLGAALADRLPQATLKRVFAIFLMIVAVRMFILSYQPASERPRPEVVAEESGP